MTYSLTNAVQAVARTLAAGDRQVLQALLDAPQHAASAGELRTFLQLAAVVQINGAMGRIGRQVHAALGPAAPVVPHSGYGWWHVIATGQHQEGRGFVWQLRGAVVTALAACSYAVSAPAVPLAPPAVEKFREGAVRPIDTHAYERNPLARLRCIEAHGAACCICGFDFGATYGAAAAGFVHVHHLTPLARIAAQYDVDPVHDLRPVCPNCHAVIHMADPPYSIEEVKALIAESQAPSKPTCPLHSLRRGPHAP